MHWPLEDDETKSQIVDDAYALIPCFQGLGFRV